MRNESFSRPESLPSREAAAEQLEHALAGFDATAAAVSHELDGIDPGGLAPESAEQIREKLRYVLDAVAIAAGIGIAGAGYEFAQQADIHMLEHSLKAAVGILNGTGITLLGTMGLFEAGQKWVKKMSSG